MASFAKKQEVGGRGGGRKDASPLNEFIVSENLSISLLLTLPPPPTTTTTFHCGRIAAKLETSRAFVVFNLNVTQRNKPNLENTSFQIQSNIHAHAEINKNEPLQITTTRIAGKKKIQT